jgi:hypothetical protein
LEVKDVKVTDENFTKIKDKPPHSENEQNSRRVSMRLVRKKEDVCGSQNEGGEEMDGEDEDGDDFGDDDVDDDDEDWQPDEEDKRSNVDENMEPKAKKSKTAGILFLIRIHVCRMYRCILIKSILRV